MTGLVIAPGFGWSLMVVLLLLLAAQSWRGAQRRMALNRALHEIRRPLQALALSSVETAPAGRLPGRQPNARPGDPLVITGSIWQAIRALGDLDRQLNGVPGQRASSELFACRLMVDACVRRWQSRAHLAGSTIELRWAGPDALVRGDGTAISGAVENLILNAIEHGGPAITVNGLTFGKWVRVEVIDSGRREQAPANPEVTRPESRSERRRHGHGLEVVRSVAADHDGRLDLELSEDGSKAVFVLPASSNIPARGVPVRVNW
ncbi:MAG: ATP-binding protein [Solirubrobacterales bacterium]